MVLIGLIDPFNFIKNEDVIKKGIWGTAYLFIKYGKLDIDRLECACGYKEDITYAISWYYSSFKIWADDMLLLFVGGILNSIIPIIFAIIIGIILKVYENRSRTDPEMGLPRT